MNIRKKVILLLCVVGLSVQAAFAQDVALKTNTLYWAAATPNLGLEVGLAPKWTLDLGATYKPFNINDDDYARFWFAQPEARYWFCEKFEGHFVGLHAHGVSGGVGLDLLLPVDRQHEGTDAEVHGADAAAPYVGAEARGLAAHVVHELHGLDSSRESGEILNHGGCGELAARLHTFVEHRGESSPRSIDRSGISGRTSAYYKAFYMFSVHILQK